MRLGICLLAAGLSRRFGSNKLMARFAGRRVIDYAMDAALAVDAVQRVAVVSDEAVTDAARARGLTIVRNERPERGMASSIALGAQALADMDAVMLMAADMPLLRGETLAGLVRAFAQGEKGIACLRDRTHWGNPAIFGRAYLPELAALSGERGAKAVIRMHEDDLAIVDCALADELADADTPQALARIAQRWGESIQ